MLHWCKSLLTETTSSCNQRTFLCAKRYPSFLVLYFSTPMRKINACLFFQTLSRHWTQRLWTNEPSNGWEMILLYFFRCCKVDPSKNAGVEWCLSSSAHLDPGSKQVHSCLVLRVVPPRGLATKVKQIQSANTHLLISETARRGVKTNGAPRLMNWCYH